MKKTKNKEVMMKYEMSADEILETIRKRQKNGVGKVSTNKEYEEYRKLQHELLTKGQQYHKLGCELTELEAMIEGCYPRHYRFWWDAELLNAFNDVKVSPKVAKARQEVKQLRDILKKRRQSVDKLN